MACLADLLKQYEIFYQIDGTSPIEFKNGIQIKNHKIYDNNFSLPLSLEDLRIINRNTSWKSDAKETTEIIKKHKIKIVITDLPAISQEWISEIRTHSLSVVFDDMPISKIKADLIINPNNASDFQSLYSTFNGKNILIGQKFNPVNKSYFQSQCNPTKQIERILVYLGSSVSFDTTNKIIKSVLNTGKNIEYIGEHSAKLRQSFGNNKSFIAINFVKYFHNHLKKYDICVGACGVAYWERCHFGIPSLILKTAENQQKDIEYLLERGAIRMIESTKIEQSLKETFSEFEKNPKILAELSKKSFSVVRDSYTVDLSELILSCTNEV